eukprot:365252-Chlamydomonas_euryale.AAC.11
MASEIWAGLARGRRGHVGGPHRGVRGRSLMRVRVRHWRRALLAPLRQRPRVMLGCPPSSLPGHLVRRLRMCTGRCRGRGSCGESAAPQPDVDCCSSTADDPTAVGDAACTNLELKNCASGSGCSPACGTALVERLPASTARVPELVACCCDGSICMAIRRDTDAASRPMPSATCSTVHAGRGGERIARGRGGISGDPKTVAVGWPSV